MRDIGSPEEDRNSERERLSHCEGIGWMSLDKISVWESSLQKGQIYMKWGSKSSWSGLG